MYIFKLLLLFLILFNFPIVYVWNSVFLSVFVSTACYIIRRRSIPLSYFYSSYCVRILTGLALIAAYSYALPLLYYTYDMGVYKVFFVQLYMLVALIYALPIIFEKVEGNSFEYTMVLIIYVFVLQGVISVVSFVFTPVSDFLLSLKDEVTLDRMEHVTFRFYSLCGNSFFDLPAGFGLAIILFFRIQFIKGQRYFTGLTKYAVFIVLLVGSCFTGRTSFVGVVLGVVTALLMSQDLVVKSVRAMRGLLICAAILLLVFLFLGESRQRTLTEDVLPFAFEFLYNYQDKRGLTTESSDILKDMYFPLEYETLLKGDGKYMVGATEFYKRTDAGYMRQVLFGGIPFLLFLAVYQFLFFITPFRLAYRVERNDLMLWAVLFVYIFILNYKGDALGRMQLYQALILLLGASYVRQYDDSITQLTPNYLWRK